MLEGTSKNITPTSITHLEGSLKFMIGSHEAINSVDSDIAITGNLNEMKENIEDIENNFRLRIRVCSGCKATVAVPTRRQIRNSNWASRRNSYSHTTAGRYWLSHTFSLNQPLSVLTRSCNINYPSPHKNHFSLIVSILFPSAGFIVSHICREIYGN